MQESTNIKDVLAQREARYGSFETHAAISQALKTVMHMQDGWERLAPDQREALEMIQHKIARILNGDATYLDNWVDLVGYPQLVVSRLEAKK
jgi:hypothetical protein